MHRGLVKKMISIIFDTAVSGNPSWHQRDASAIALQTRFARPQIQLFWPSVSPFAICLSPQLKPFQCLPLARVADRQVRMTLGCG